MAKKRKTSKKPKESGPKHSLPDGFWSQVGAISLIALAILFVVSWFNAGGPVLSWLFDSTKLLIGYGVYVIPFLAVYLAISIFRVENNKLPMAVKIAALLFMILLAGLFGLFKDAGGFATGGLVGDSLNFVMLNLVNSGVAIFIYILLLFLMMMFMFSISPFSIVTKIWGYIRKDSESGFKVNQSSVNYDEDKNENQSSQPVELKINNMNQIQEEPSKPRRLSSFKNSIKDLPNTEEQTALVAMQDVNWNYPSLNLLERKQIPPFPGNAREKAGIIKDTLKEFKIDVVMDHVNVGPRVSQYTLTPPLGVKLSKIAQLEDNLALRLEASSLRIEAPIPGQKYVGIEVPNEQQGDVRIRTVMESQAWKNSHEQLTFAIGKDVHGNEVVGELNKMPHILIAGQTGSGKSVMINTLLVSLLYHNNPSEMRLILVDPKEVELAMYSDIPHLLTPVITKNEKTISALKWATVEMDSRYSLMVEHGVKDIKSYNKKMQELAKNKDSKTDEEDDESAQSFETMPYIVIVIDELNDLMMQTAKETEPLIVRLAQKGRASGIHLVLATQRPSVNVITGLIKANVPARIAFTTVSQVDSRTILDASGSEKLLNNGDMLFMGPGSNQLQRIQGAWVTEEEVQKVTNHLRKQMLPQYNDDVISQPAQMDGKGGVVMDFDTPGDDPVYRRAVELVISTRKASTTFLQTRLRLGYARAARYIQHMEDQGIIGPGQGSKPRDVLYSSIEEFDEINTPEV